MYRQAGNSIAVPVLNALIKQLLPFFDLEEIK
jgi:site-specific DNA-cytosine methylase